MNIVRLLLFIIILLLITSMAWFVFEFALDAYAEGYRYWTLKMELILFPVALLVTIFFLGKRLFMEKSVTPKVVRSGLKWMALMFALVVFSFLAGMIFNDINAPGAHI